MNLLLFEVGTLPICSTSRSGSSVAQIQGKDRLPDRLSFDYGAPFICPTARFWGAKSTKSLMNYHLIVFGLGFAPVFTLIVSRWSLGIQLTYGNSWTCARHPVPLFQRRKNSSVAAGVAFLLPVVINR